MSYLNLLDVLSSNFTVIYYTRNSDYKHEQMSKHPYSPETLRNVKITCKRSAHFLWAPIRRIYRGGRRHHADMSVVVLIALSCRSPVLPGHKDYMKHHYHRIAAGADTDFVGTCTPALSLSYDRSRAPPKTKTPQGVIQCLRFQFPTYSLFLNVTQQLLTSSLSSSLLFYPSFYFSLTLILLTWTIWRDPTNASKWRMGFSSAFKGLNNLF